jgi:hypothetical protein
MEMGFCRRVVVRQDFNLGTTKAHARHFSTITTDRENDLQNHPWTNGSDHPSPTGNDRSRNDVGHLPLGYRFVLVEKC